MLFKLMKYDLKSMLKTILPLWIVALIISAAYGIFNGLQVDNTYTHITMILILVCLFIAIVVINIILIIQRFWNGLLKDEGYLMFTIPTSPRMLIFSKALSSTIISCITGMIAYLSVMLVFGIYMNFYNPEVFMDIWKYIQQLTSQYLLSFVIFIFAAIIGTLQKIYVFYAAMAFGHLSNKNRFLCSVAAFVIINTVIGTFTSILMAITGKAANLFSSITISSISYGTEYFNLNMIYATILALLLTIVLHFITEYILSHKLNLE